jgi:6-phosphogluconolactonase
MVLVFRTVEELSRSAAELFVAAARRFVAERGRFCAALSGGRTPRRVFGLLAGADFARRMPWDKTHIFWADERLVPTSSPSSNAGLAERLFLRRVAIPADHIHEMPVDLDPRRAAAEYESTLRRFFGDRGNGLDLVFLGLGEDGHTASLFPRSSALAEKKRWVVSVVRKSEGLHRLTLTAPFLSRSREVVFIAYGREKAAPLARALGADRPPGSLPARLIRPAGGRVVWLVDKKASALLTSCELTSGDRGEAAASGPRRFKNPAAGDNPGRRPRRG